MGLCRLYRATGDEKYLDEAKFFWTSAAARAIAVRMARANSTGRMPRITNR